MMIILNQNYLVQKYDIRNIFGAFTTTNLLASRSFHPSQCVYFQINLEFFKIIPKFKINLQIYLFYCPLHPLAVSNLLFQIQILPSGNYDLVQLVDIKNHGRAVS